jgi:hypothetical protein
MPGTATPDGGASRAARMLAVLAVTSLSPAALADEPQAQPASDQSKPAPAQPAKPPPAPTPAGPARGSSDELTDADFGVVAPTVTVAPPRGRESLAWIDVAVGLALSSRKFDFDSAPGMDAARPPGFRSGWSWRPSAALELRPLARRSRGGLLEGLGLLAEYGRTLGRASGGDPDLARESRLYLALAYRIAVGTSDAQPIFGASAGFVRQQVRILDDSIDLPDVGYEALALGADVRIPLGTPRVAVCGLARYLVVGDGGEIVRPETYGDSRTAGLEVGVSLEVRALANVFVRLAGSHTRYSIDFNGTGMLSNPGAVGATDQYTSATVSAGLAL